MDLGTRRRLIANMLDVGIDRVWMDPNRLEEIKEAITKSDLRALINDKAIQIRHSRGISGFRRKKRIKQKKKGRRHGRGSFKGKRTARLPRKREWINKIRLQREFLSRLKDKKMLSSSNYSILRARAKGGFFRNLRHVKTYLSEHNLIEKEHGKK